MGKLQLFRRMNPGSSKDDTAVTWRDLKLLQDQIQAAYDPLVKLVAGLQGSAVTPLAGIAAALALMPTGAELVWAGTAAPTGWLLESGQVLNRTIYPALWALVNNPGNGFPLVSDATWLAGAVGSFSSGDGSTTFRLPKPAGLFVRATGTQSLGSPAVSYAGPALGAVQQDQVQGHFHVPLGGSDSFLDSLASGGTEQVPGAGTTVIPRATTGAPTTDGSNGTPRTGVETRPANFGRNWIVKT